MSRTLCAYTDCYYLRAPGSHLCPDHTAELLVESAYHAPAAKIADAIYEDALSRVPIDIRRPAAPPPDYDEICETCCGRPADPIDRVLSDVASRRQRDMQRTSDTLEYCSQLLIAALVIIGAVTVAAQVAMWLGWMP